MNIEYEQPQFIPEISRLIERKNFSAVINLIKNYFPKVRNS